ncbi:histidine kinase [uncultured Chitinophaga sp.]|uniref:tetratricopeptide repeat-containing sensor histidine kinase n=1 Tax=uncultured Chitinophaga sp. TaxID=339340 RepID=UPI0025DD610D|nr:histidine kinase [uncultured Chitinophaga sp.]
MFLLLACLYLATATAADSPQDSCQRLVRSGNGYLWRFLPKEAYAQYHEALKIAVSIDNYYWKGDALQGVAQALWYMGYSPAAIDTVKLAIGYYRKAGATSNIGGALRILSNIYDDMGDYENAFITVTEALAFFDKHKGQQDNWILSLVQMGALYTNLGDYETAMEYYDKAEALQPYRGQYPFREMNHRIGELFAAQGDIKTARAYYKKALIGNPRSKIVRLRLGDSYMQEKKYDVAFTYYDTLYREAKLTTDGNIIIAAMLGMGRVYLQQGDLEKAAAIVNGSLEHSSVRGARQNKRDAYEILAAISEARGHHKQALQYQRMYERLKDSVFSENYKRQLFTFRQEEESEKLIAQRNILGVTIVAIVLVALFVLFIIILRHKNEKLHLRQRADELKMQALRAQMNPHFIFNCLTAINHFILAEEGDKASEYLTRFSKLIRMVLVNAGKTVVTLEEELTMLRLYLNMEQLRFKQAFDYDISFENGLHASMVNVPSFILQPFCENAIWHGLLHKEGKGQLTIYFAMEREVLICTISDNGIGRRKAKDLNTSPVEKGASFGNRLSAERLAIFNGEVEGTSFVMDDVLDANEQVAGTRVILKIHNKQAHD